MNNQKILELIIRAKEDVSSTMSKLSDNIEKNVGTARTNVKSFGDSFADGMKTASIALTGVGIGLTLYEKQSADFTKQLVTDSRRVANVTGETQEQSSRLLYVMQHLGMSTDEASTQFTIFARHVSDARDASSNTAIKQEELKNKIEATKIQIAQQTSELQKHGDTSGELRNKIDGLSTSLKGYQQQLSEATDPLQKLNVNTQNADGSNRSFNQILLDVADRFKQMPDGVEKTAAAVDLFGRSGAGMIKLLDQGSDGIKHLEDESDKLGITLTQKTIGSIQDYIESQKKLKETSDSLKIAVGTLTAPALAKLNDGMSSVLGVFQKADGPWKTIIADAIAFGGPVASGTGAVLGFASNLFQAKSSMLEAGVNLGSLALRFGAVSAIVATVGTGIWFLGDRLGWWKGKADDANQSNTKLVGSMDLLQLAAQRVSDAQQKVADTTVAIQRAQDAIAPASTALAGAQQTLADRQMAVNDALKIYGDNSPQYVSAVNDLDKAQQDLALKMNDSAGATLTVEGAKRQLKLANDDLRKATQFQTGVQQALTDGLSGTVQVIKGFGPAAANQISAIDSLDQSVNNVINQSQRMDSLLQGAVTNAQINLQGLGSSIDRLQSQGKNLTNQLQRAGTNLQGNTGTAAVPGVYQARAAGGEVNTGVPYIVGEQGRELFVPKEDGQIVSAPNTRRMLAGGHPVSFVINQTNNNYHEYDQRAANEQLGFMLQQYAQ